MKLGIDVLLESPELRRQLAGRRLALLAHPASMTAGFQHSPFQHSIDALSAFRELKLTAAFGPQHGMRGEKQDNMMETDDFTDPVLGIPVYSLYGKVRRPTPAMLDTFDVLLFDLQDVGTRIYTFLTTLLYVLEAGAASGKEVWVLDRPNPIGRPIEGSLLREGWRSFVGAAELPMRHGLTLGEAARWFVTRLKIDVKLRVVEMQGYAPDSGPGYGWPLGELPWVNPSPNAATLSMARAFPGTVMIEGTELSEGRGTTHPLEMIGAPDLDGRAWLAAMERLEPAWMKGCKLRPCAFQPTFQKHAGKMCSGFQVHLDDSSYAHEIFKPYRLMALAFKAVRKLRPDYPLWRDFHYEYEKDRLAIDLINGGSFLREWVDDPNATPADFERYQVHDEKLWLEDRREFLCYR